MKTPPTLYLPMPVKVVLAAVLLSALTGLAFAMWIDNGGRMLMAMARTGLAWCF